MKRCICSVQSAHNWITVQQGKANEIKKDNWLFYFLESFQPNCNHLIYLKLNDSSDTGYHKSYTQKNVSDQNL